MKLLAAPVIHARTKNNDFPASLLVVPEDFSPEIIAWARGYITASTGWFELTRNAGRRVVFCDQQRIVSGISIRIADLCQLCGTNNEYTKVNSTRVNYAFIGLAFSKEEAAGKNFDLPPTLFLQLYEQYMALRWEEPFSESGLTALKVGYTEFEVPEQTISCELQIVEPFSPRMVIDTSTAAESEIAAVVTAQMQDLEEYSFCSNLPNTKSVLESRFLVVTSPNAQVIIENLLKKEPEKQEAEQETENRKAKRKDTARSVGGLSGFLSCIKRETTEIEEDGSKGLEKSDILVERILKGAAGMLILLCIRRMLKVVVPVEFWEQWGKDYDFPGQDPFH